LGRIENALEEDDDPSIDRDLENLKTLALDTFSSALPRDPKQKDRPGMLVCNPTSFTRRVSVRSDQLSSLPKSDRPVYAAGNDGKTKEMVLDVPSLGFAWIEGQDGPAAENDRQAIKLAEDLFLRNEFFEAKIDPESGGVRAIHQYNARGNRMSQQLALRYGDVKASRSSWDYTKMVATSIETTVSTPLRGEIVARGNLVNDQGDEEARFKQTYEILRGRRVLNIDIELEHNVDLIDDGWNSYFASRFAWKDEAAELKASVNQVAQSVSNKRLEAPHYISVVEGEKSTTILTGGNPWHCRQGYRELDTILAVQGETQMVSRLGIGVDLVYPMQQAVALLSPPIWKSQSASPPSPVTSSWLFHLGAKNVFATEWEPIIEAGKVVGVRAKLLEVMGRIAKVSLSGFRPFIAAKQVDMQGEQLSVPKIEAGRVEFEMGIHEYLVVEAKWA